MREGSYKKTGEDMPPPAAKIEDNTLGSCHSYCLLSTSIFLYLLLSSMILSCTGSTVFHSYKPLPREGWERRDTVCFSLPKATEDTDATLTIGLRTVAHVGLQDIVLAVEQASETGDDSRCDTIRYPLADAEGNALARGVNSHQYEDRQLPLRLQSGKECHIRIRHLMTREVIPGITEVGIRVDRQ